jgi:hypothetical protein
MEVLIGKSSINGPLSMAMLNNQRVNVTKTWTFQLQLITCHRLDRLAISGQFPLPTNTIEMGPRWVFPLPDPHQEGTRPVQWGNSDPSRNLVLGGCRWGSRWVWLMIINPQKLGYNLDSRDTDFHGNNNWAVFKIPLSFHLILVGL